MGEDKMLTCLSCEMHFDKPKKRKEVLDIWNKFSQTYYRKATETKHCPYCNELWTP